MPKLILAVERFPIAGRFVISRGAKSEAIVVTATIEEPGARGRGECVPYARYGESIDLVLAQIESVRSDIEAGADQARLQHLLPAGAARNALDCALWDLGAKRTGIPAHQLAGMPAPKPVTTAFTISVGTPGEMAAAAGKAAHRPLLKIKLAGEGDPARIRAVRRSAPDATLIVDANEAWKEADLERNLAACAREGVALVEQPLSADHDGALATIDRIIPVCADESVHDRHGLEGLRSRYDAINVKLDKTGGLTEALHLLNAAEKLEFRIVAGCMVASSLAMAPALLIAGKANYVDLDGPLLLAADRSDGLIFQGSVILPAKAALWG